MRDPNKITSSFYKINDLLIKRKNELIDKFPNLNNYNYHIGIFREELIKQTLIDCLNSESIVDSKKIFFGSGFIVDCNGKFSKQIDILIFHSNTDTYNYGMFTVVHANNVIAAIEIKSKLTKNNLLFENGALNNVDSVRELELNQHHIFTAIIGFEGIKKWQTYKKYLSTFYANVFRQKMKEFIRLHEQYEQTDLSTKRFTPDLIMTLDGILILFGVKSDLNIMRSRPTAFFSKPEINKFTTFQFLIYEILINILRFTKHDKPEERLFDYLNFSQLEIQKGYSIENLMGIDYENSVYLNKI